MKVKRRMHKYKVAAVKREEVCYGRRYTKLISLMMRRKILFWTNLVLSGFISDVIA